jgi:hypothetical protein
MKPRHSEVLALILFFLPAVTSKKRARKGDAALFLCRPRVAPIALLSGCRRHKRCFGSLDPTQLHPYGSPLFVVPGGTPRPIAGVANQFGSNGILVHVRQLLSHFLRIVQIERVVFCLPERFFFSDLFGVVTQFLVNELPNVMGAQPFPLLKKNTELAGNGEPDNSMNVVGHHHKTDTNCIPGLQLRIEYAEHHSLCLIMIQ